MSLAPGTRLGVYEITSRIGAGGMGEVYRARDTTLDRDVALKLLPAEFSKDSSRLARFEREAKALASLNHANIAQIYGFESGASGMAAIVMEFVDGQDLAERLRRGAFAIDDALNAARQVADALEVAHTAGVIHRDLKPGNVKIRPDGVVKVLDFGLAKLARDQSPEGAEANDATMTSPVMTGVGVVLGTAAYMAPEQARGLAVDKRADVWAFGCLLFEMLAGQRLFGAESATETITAVLTREPRWTRLPEETPEPIRRLLRRCVVRDPRQRLSDIGVARLEIDDALSDAKAPAEPQRRRFWPVVAGGILGIALGAAVAINWPQERLPERILTAGDTLAAPQLSPDGHYLVYVRDERIVVRPVSARSTGDERMVPDTEGAQNPFWSPDSTSIAYFRRGALGEELRAVPATGGASRPVIGAAQGARDRPRPIALHGGTWCVDGIVFRDGNAGTMRKVDATTGATLEVFDTPDGSLAYPYCLPDGRILAVQWTNNRSTNETASVVVAKPKEQVVLATMDVTSQVDVRWPVLVGSSDVVFERTDPTQGLWTVPVNEGITPSTDVPRLLLPDAFRPSTGGAMLTAVTGMHTVNRNLVWVDQYGNNLGSFGKPQREFRSPSLSPSADQVMTAGRRDKTQALWLHSPDIIQPWQVVGGVNGIAWSPNGKFIAYGTVPINGERGGLVVRTKVGNEVGRIPNGARPSWTPGSDELFFQRGSNGIWSVRPFAERVIPEQIVDGALEASVSGNGKLIAYVKDEAGSFEVYVAPREHPNEGIRISTDGGRYPLWSTAGLFFPCGPPAGDTPNANGAMCLATVDPISGARRDVTKLFDANARGFRTIMYGARGYDVTRDGKRLLVQTDGLEGTPSITLIENVKGWLKTRR